MPAIKSPYFSVIVPSHRPSSLKKICVILNTIYEERGDTEIVIVTDYHHHTYKKQWPCFMWIFIDDNSISKKRNVGIQNATGSICAFIDDDCIPQKDWLLAAKNFLSENNDVCAVEGKTVIQNPSNKKKWFREYMRLEKPHFRTNNIFYRKDILVKCGGFDERFTVQREDTDLAFTILSKGYFIGFDDSINVTHEHRNDHGWDLLKNCRNRFFDPLLHKKHTALYRKEIGTPFPYSLRLIGLLLICFFISIPFSWYYTTIFFIAICMISLYFTYKRNGKLTNSNMSMWFKELISFPIAPIVLLITLLRSSMKYRNFLLF